MTAEYFAPAFRVVLDGDRVPADVSASIVSATVNRETGTIDSCSLVLTNPYPAMPWTHGKGAELFKEGTALQVWMGYRDQLELMFDGDITGQTPDFPESGAPTLTVQGQNRLHRLSQNTALIDGTDVTDGDLASEVAKASGLQVKVDDPGTRYPKVSNNRRPHLQFLLERARAANREVWVEGRTLHFAKPRATAPFAYTLVWAMTHESFTPGTMPLLSFSPSLDVSRQVSTVIVRGQHPSSREIIEGRATHGSEDTKLGGAETGPQARERALGNPNEWVVLNAPVTSQAEAEDRARALFNDRAMQFIQGTGATIGLPKLVAGTVVRLDGVGRFNGQYYVTRSTHAIGASGFRTTFSVRKNSLG